ncbi:MAG: hypothetical protein CM1200mP33_7770 [Chloroflexota bacterium]|nr:MAG: hypothetical protein CM1200mP33_7770 [Chloroflexota bacterium]
MKLQTGVLILLLMQLVSSKTMEQILPSVRDGGSGADNIGGKAVLIGIPAVHDISVDPRNFMFKHKQYIGILKVRPSPEQDFEMYLRWHKEGIFPLDKLVTDRYTLEDIAIACDDLHSGKITGRAIVKFLKKFTYKNLKLFLYLFSLLFIFNFTFLKMGDKTDINITEISQEINNSIIYKNENGDLNIFTEDGNNIMFSKADINTEYFWPTISKDNNFISYSYVNAQITDYKIGIKILDILNNNTYEIYSEINPIKNVLSNQIPHYMAWSLIDNILSFVVPTANYPALFIHKTTEINNVRKLVENGPVWVNWNENNLLSVHRRSKRLIFDINNSITNLINTNEVSPFYRLDAWGSLDATSNDIYSVFQKDEKFKHIIKSDISNNTFKFY